MLKRVNRPPAEIGKFNIELENQKITYAVKRSYRARCVRLEIHRQTGLTVFIPRFYKVNDLSEVLVRKGNWILDKLEEFSKVNGAALCKGSNNSSIPYLGRRLKIIKKHIPGMEINIKLEEDHLCINFDKANISLSCVVELWYRQQANELLRKRTDELCTEFGVNYNRITIRKARTRWGSCSQRGNLNFNWKLMMVPEPVIDYVIIHELTHLKEMNHSKRFWDVVTTNCPDWRKRKQWLEDHEAELNAINL